MPSKFPIGRLWSSLAVNSDRPSHAETPSVPTIEDLARRLLADSRPYHPLGHHVPPSLKRPDEAFKRRWAMVSGIVERFAASSFCDLGCAEGYYVRRVAQEHGIFSIGIDSDARRLSWATAVSILDDDWSCGFMHMKLDSTTLRGLPVFDIIACMSLVHHIIYREGLAEAKAMLSVIAEKTHKCMLFDMGGPDEDSNAWASSLSMFSGDVDRNIIGMLEETGFRNVTAIGRSVGYNTSAERTMFIAEPPT